MGVSAGVETLDPEFNMTLPDSLTYSDINTDTPLPELTMSRIISYYQAQGKDFEKKYEQIYLER